MSNKRTRKPITIRLNNKQTRNLKTLVGISNDASNRLLLYLISAGDASKATIPEDFGLTEYNVDKGTATFGPPPKEQADGEPTP